MVGISLLTLVPGVVGGTETYARALTRALADLSPREYVVYLPSVAPDAHGGLPHRVMSSYRAAWSEGGRIRAMAEASMMPGALRREMELDRLDLVHFPLTVMLPRIEQPPSVITVHDVAHLVVPEFYSRSQRLYRAVVYGWSLRRATLVITISEHVKGTLEEELGIDPARIRVIPIGVDLEGLGPSPAPREPFVLYPANYWPHKNHARLIAAFAQVRRTRPELRLVLTGARHPKDAAANGVEFRGYVPRSELIRLYQTASALVFPSLYEGQGLPVVEAMACGCPVAASNAGSLPEVCGGAAVTFDPTSVEAIAGAILDALDTGERLRARGLRRAAAFSADTCARAHEQAFRETIAIAGRGKPVRSSPDDEAHPRR